jgi:CheY-like chemotaxis protein
MTTRMLIKAGFEVREAHTGEAALRLAEDLPDVIVLDVRLPDIDGFEVCRRVRANARTARIKILHTSATFAGPFVARTHDDPEPATSDLVEAEVVGERYLREFRRVETGLARRHRGGEGVAAEVWCVRRHA